MENTEHDDFAPSSNKPVKDLLSLAISEEQNIEEEEEQDQPSINLKEEAADESSQEDSQSHVDALMPDKSPPAMVKAGRIGGFPTFPRQRDELKIPLLQLKDGRFKSRLPYDFASGIGKVLAHAAQDPESLAPIEVIKIDEQWYVLDGWARVEALLRQFGSTDNIMVRAIQSSRSIEDALYREFSREYLSLTKQKIDKACVLLQFQRKWNVSQISLAAKVGKKESQVKKDLKAAKAYLEVPQFTKILERSDDPSVDYCYQIQCGREAALQADMERQKAGLEGTAMAELDRRLEELIGKEARLSANDALVALGLKEPKVEDGNLSPETMEAGDEWIFRDFVAGSDDQPAINILFNPQDLLRFDFLVVPSELPAPEKEELKLRLFERLARIFE